MSVAGLRPGLGRGGTTHSLLVSVTGGEPASGEVGDEAGIGFIHSDGGLCIAIEVAATLAPEASVFIVNSTAVFVSTILQVEGYLIAVRIMDLYGSVRWLSNSQPS